MEKKLVFVNGAQREARIGKTIYIKFNSYWKTIEQLEEISRKTGTKLEIKVRSART